LANAKIIGLKLESYFDTVPKMRSLQLFMDDCNHDMAIRMYAGQLSLQPALTPNGKKYRLLNLPYFLGEKINEYLGWMKDRADETS